MKLKLDALEMQQFNTDLKESFSRGYWQAMEDAYERAVHEIDALSGCEECKHGEAGD